VGSKKNAIWRVVVADQRSPRDGRIIESLGHYNPQTQPSTIVIDRERLDHWLGRGAQPSNTIRKLMRSPNTVAQQASTRNVPDPESIPEPDPDAAAGVAAESGTDADAAPEAGADAAAEPEPAAEPEAQGAADGEASPDQPEA
jgi:small subunit ribosomal protein S16